MTNCKEAYEYYTRKAEQQEKDFIEMANIVESYMQKYCHPHNTVIATLDGIEVVEGIKAKGFKILD